MPDCDVLLFGDYFCDIIVTGLSEVPRLGADIFGDSMEIAPGGAYILTVALHRLGVKTRWAARLGNDLFSCFLLEEARREGIDTCLFEQFPVPYRSMSVSFSFAHDRGFISHTDLAPEGKPIYEIIAREKPRWVVNTPFDGSSETLALLDFIHNNGGRVFSDCQYTTLTLNDPGMTAFLSATDIFAPNLSEACQLTGVADPETAAEILARTCPLVVIKCGADGALARAGSLVWHAPTLPVKAVDTTGAGDCFDAGFLDAWLRGEPLTDCLLQGNICGALSTRKMGGINGFPQREELNEWRSKSR
jgi:sugar/nucleoside kinase (ribokinase family)